MATDEPVLVVDGLTVRYGRATALDQVSIAVKPGEVVALLGANGAGKTTMLNAISGIRPAAAGGISWQGQPILRQKPHRIFAAGIIQVSQGRNLFPEMSVLENLRLGAIAARGRADATGHGLHVVSPPRRTPLATCRDVVGRRPGARAPLLLVGQKMTYDANPWDDIIPAEEQRAYRAAGFGRPSGLGTRPALLIIDVQYRTVGTTPLPFFEAIKEFPTSCGEVAWRAVANIQRLLALFREQEWPVLYPYVARKESFDTGRLAAKAPALMTVAERGYDFVAEIAPREGDILLPKKHPSAFFGTPLASYLIDLRADTLIVTGCSTSGHVRHERTADRGAGASHFVLALERLDEHDVGPGIGISLRPAKRALFGNS